MIELETFDSTFPQQHVDFVRIIETNDEAFKKVFEISNINNYNNGPYYRIKLSDNLVQKLKHNTIKQKTGLVKLNVLDSVKNAYDNLVDEIMELFSDSYGHLASDEMNNLQIYHSENAGIEIQLNFYLTVNDKIIDEIINEYKKENINENINETACEEQPGYISSIWSYFVGK